MTGDPNDPDFRAYVERWLTAIYNREAADILARIDEVEARTVGDNDVIMLGYDGQIDAIWACPEPRPEILHLPLRPSARSSSLSRPTERRTRASRKRSPRKARAPRSPAPSCVCPRGPTSA